MLTPGRIIRNRVLHLGSAKILPREFLKIKKNNVSGTLIRREVKMPAETTLFSPLGLPAVRDLIIKRETVMGIPEAERVINTPIRERAIWYRPSPSDPTVLDKKIL